MTKRGYELTDRDEPVGPSSRNSARWAGWSRVRSAYHPGAANDTEDGYWTWPKDDSAHGGYVAHLDRRIAARWGNFSWLSTRALLDSANDRIVKVINDLVGPQRQRWIAAQRAATPVPHDDFVLAKTDYRRFLILGDPGEADGSQYAVIDPMLNVGSTDFMLVLSDVIYPAGDVNDYVNGFYVPFRDYRRPIYALPGNHDWYDGLNGFMRAFCGAEPLPPTEYRRSSFTAGERVASRLWRQASRPEITRLNYHRARREVDEDGREPVQPAPYFAMDIAGVRLVGIDTGIAGHIDAEQGEWLARVSRESGVPKVLLTGKPIWVDGEYKPTPIEWEPGEIGTDGYETVDDVVRDPRNRYVAAIGGDTHNYQRFTVTVEDERRNHLRHDGNAAVGHTLRRLEYIVSGGAGAYTSATHRIPYVHHAKRESARDRARRRLSVKRRGNYRNAKYDPPATVKPVTETEFRSYPLRGDSLAYYARWWGPRVMNTLGVTFVYAVALIILLAWRDGQGDRVDGHSLWAVFGVAPAPVGIALILAVFGLGARMAAPRGYRTVSIVIAAAVVLAAALILPPESWDWIGSVLLITLGVIALPLVVALVSYYGLGTGNATRGARMPRNVALTALVVVEVIIVFDHHLWPDDAHDRALTVVAAAIVVWASILAIAWGGAWLGSRIARHPVIAWILLLAALTTAIGALIVKFWDDADAARIAFTAIAFVATVLPVAVLGWLMLNGGLPVLLRLELFKGRRRINPNEAIAYVNARYGTHEAGTARAASTISGRTKRVGKLLLPRDGKKRKINTAISEIGNADTPPMFKNFLCVEVSEDKKTLVITCLGVTGWRAHDGHDGHPIPVEDRVTIDLEVARGTKPPDDRQVHLSPQG